MPRTLTFILGVVTFMVPACSGNPSSPTTVPPATYEGVWTGAGRLQNCADPAGASYCEGAFSAVSLSRFQLTLRRVAGQLEGTLDLSLARFNVAGTVVEQGALEMSGQGTVNGQGVTLTDAVFTAQGETLTGTYSYTAYTGSPAPPQPILTYGLDHVAHTTTAAHLPAESRLSFDPRPTTASREAPRGPLPGRTDYSICYSMTNVAGIGGRIVDVVMIPIAPDGTEYRGLAPQSALPWDIPQFAASGCSGSAMDPDYTRPIATRYRLRISFVYNDGVSGSAEGSNTVRITRDTYGQ